MLKIKIAVFVLSLNVAVALSALVAASPTRADTKQSTVDLPAVEKARTQCSVKAYRSGVDGNDEKTSIVRHAPGKKSAVLKTVVTGDEPVYYITGSNGDWFEISKIQTIGADSDKVLFRGRGWIHSSLISLSVANSDAKLYAAPQKTSRVLKKLIADESEARPVACRDDWMQVKSGKSTGWLSPAGQCANPLTTCS